MSLRKISFLLVVTAICLSSYQALALNVQLFRPKADRYETLTLEGSSGLKPLEFQFGTFINYVKDPLELNTSFQNLQVAGLVQSFITMDLVFALGIADWLTLDANVPMNLFEDLSEFVNLSEENNFALGDALVRLNFRILNNQKSPVGISLVPFVSIPMSQNTENFFNNESYAYGGVLAVDKWFGKQDYLALNVGAKYRNQFDDETLSVSIPVEKEALLGLAYVHAFSEKRTSDIILELKSSTALDNFYGSIPVSPLEMIAAYRARFGDRFMWAFGAGTGLSNGYGAPELRVFTGVTYNFSRSEKPKKKPEPKPVAKPKPKKRSISQLVVYVRDDLGKSIDAEIIVKNKEGKLVDERFGSTWEKYLKPGIYEVTAVKDGYTRHTKEVLLRNGKRLKQAMVIGKIKKEGEKIEYLGKIYFDFNQASLKQGSYLVLDEVVDILQRHVEVTLVQIEAHTDSKGSQKYNLDLSERRAETVMNYLISSGIEPSRLSYKGYGESRPIASNQTEDGRAENRRVEFSIIEAKGESGVY